VQKRARRSILGWIGPGGLNCRWPFLCCGATSPFAHGQVNDRSPPNSAGFPTIGKGRQWGEGV
jgi:hypothetical protein